MQAPQDTSLMIKLWNLAVSSPRNTFPPVLAMPKHHPPTSPTPEQKFTFKLILQVFLLSWRSAFPAAPEEKALVVSSETKVK